MNSNEQRIITQPTIMQDLQEFLPQIRIRKLNNHNRLNFSDILNLSNERNNCNIENDNLCNQFIN